MIKYRFYRNEINNPRFTIDETFDYDMLLELGSLSTDEIEEAVKEMEMVKEGALEDSDFGGVSTYVFCYKAGTVEPYTSVEIAYNYGDNSIEVPFDEIYNLMKDWLAYIKEWEKETGLKKK